MSTSPPMEIVGTNPEINARPQLVYVAALFKGTLQAKPLATLQVTGTTGFYVDQIVQALEKLQVPRPKILPLVFTNPVALPPISFSSMPPNFNIEYRATILIDYGDSNPHRQKFSVAFKPEGKEFPIEVEFEVAPDGTNLTEVKAEWSTPLKTVIGDSARMGYRQVKFATKIVGLAGFDRKTVNNIETELKGKLKQTLSFYLRTSGHEYVKIQFYGAIGAKYADDKVKPLGEVGFLFEIPFDLADVLK